MEHYLEISDIAPLFTSVESDKVMPMEMLPINNNGGQGYGFVLYQAELQTVPREITIFNISDNAQVLLDGRVIYRTDVMKQGTWKNIHYMDQTELWKVNIERIHSEKDLSKLPVLDILVENMGRSNILPVMNIQRKGILGDVFMDGKILTGWKIFALEFKRGFFDKLRHSSISWETVTEVNKTSSPLLFRGTFNIEGAPKDTFVYMKDWTKGVVFINGHNLGRYWDIGPQETLYLPAPWLHRGKNEIFVFELEKCKFPQVSFTLEPKMKGEPLYVE